MSENIAILVLSAVVNGAVTWGVVSTKLEWFRRDLDNHAARLDYLERRR
jgi:hypothetical protein